MGVTSQLQSGGDVPGSLGGSGSSRPPQDVDAANRRPAVEQGCGLQYWDRFRGHRAVDNQRTARSDLSDELPREMYSTASNIAVRGRWPTAIRRSSSRWGRLVVIAGMSGKRRASSLALSSERTTLINGRPRRWKSALTTRPTDDAAAVCIDNAVIAHRAISLGFTAQQGCGQRVDHQLCCYSTARSSGTTTTDSAGATTRDMATLSRAIFTTGCVLDGGEAPDSSRALAEAGPLAAVFFHNLTGGSLDFQLRLSCGRRPRTAAKCTWSRSRRMPDTARCTRAISYVYDASVGLSPTPSSA